MNGMKLGGLDKEPKPFGRPDVGMVKVLARGAEKVGSYRGQTTLSGPVNN
jgi:hypothetical protein